LTIGLEHFELVKFILQILAMVGTLFIIGIKYSQRMDERTEKIEFAISKQINELKSDMRSTFNRIFSNQEVIGTKVNGLKYTLTSLKSEHDILKAQHFLCHSCKALGRKQDIRFNDEDDGGD